MSPFKLILLTIINVIILQQNYYAQFNNEINKVSFNSTHNDYYGVNYLDGVLFCSNRKESILVSQIDTKTSEPLSRYYFSKKNENSYGAVEKFDKIFSGIYQYGAFCFTDNDSTIYFTRSSIDDSLKTYLSIFIAKKTKNGWSNPVPFIYNSPKYNVGHPCINKEGNKMYFVSDMQGGYGGKDIYFCEKIDEEWEIPVNVGSIVNSKKNELFPFFNNSEILYFSSDREGGIGKLDVYSTSKISDRFIKPELLPEPVNSKYDDFTYFSDKSEMKGFISSNRSGRDKIYEFSDTRPRFNNCDTLISFDPCYVFFDETEVNIDTLPLIYNWSMGDGTFIKQKEANHCYKKAGNYTVRLEIIDTLTNAIFFSGQSFDMLIEEPKQAHIEIFDTIPMNNLVFMNAKKSTIDNFEPFKYYWDISKLSSKEGLEVSQIFPEEGNYRINLGVVGKPDKNGAITKSCVFKDVFVSSTINYNDYLTKLKSTTAADSLEQSALNIGDIFASKNIITSESKNKSMLNYLTTEQKIDNLFNSDANYVSDEIIKETLSSLSMNRADKIEKLNSLSITTVYNKSEEITVYKVEIINSKERISLNNKLFDPLKPKYVVTENYISKDETYSYAVGEEKNLSATYPIYSELKKMKYKEAIVKGYALENIVELSNIENIKKESLNNSIFRTENVFFKTMEHTVETSFYSTLQKIIDLMLKYPKIFVEISAHTDNSGTREYNLLLSEKRAQNTVEYLVKNGIDPKRLKGLGFGYDQPIAPNNSEENMQKNRRVDFKIIEKN